MATLHTAPSAMAKEEKMLTTRTPDEETEDGRIHNREATTKIRNAWIFKQMRARQDEFTQYRTVSFWMNRISLKFTVQLFLSYRSK